MTAAFDARIEGRAIRCVITPDACFDAPVFCFSIMAPAVVVSGGTCIASLGGYTEVALPSLTAGVPHEVVIAYENPDFVPVNRAWLPLGPYLRSADGLTELPALPAGVRHVPPAAAPNVAGNSLRLCPPPESWVPAEGVLDGSRGFACDHEAFGTVAEIDIGSNQGTLPFLMDSGIGVSLETDPDLGPEAYRLRIAPDGIVVSASARPGIFYGAITLRHLQITHHGEIPCGFIKDAPRFSWRGQHLDCARHFFRPGTICQLLDLMALFKLNRFHWHFADDEAFRLELDCYPELWQTTAYRGEGKLIPGVFGGGILSGGSYSKADMAAIIAHAERRSIQILPEVELPAHALALNRALPGLRDPKDRGREVSVQGYRENVINPALDQSWKVMEALTTEVSGLFPFAHIHLGCDELPLNTWAGSGAIEALKAREGLRSTHDVQGWMMERIAAHVAAAGVRPAAWEEAARGANGGIGNDAILFSWTGQDQCVEAARRGYDIVMSPAQHVYLDMAHSPDPDDWGAGWAAFISLEDTIAWSPVPRGAADILDRVIGIESTFWSEFTTEDSELWPMLMPRLMGVASKAWERAEALDGPGLRRLADAYRASMAGFWDWNHGA